MSQNLCHVPNPSLVLSTGENVRKAKNHRETGRYSKCAKSKRMDVKIKPNRTEEHHPIGRFGGSRPYVVRRVYISQSVEEIL